MRKFNSYYIKRKISWGNLIHTHIGAKSVPNFWNLMIFDVRGGVTPTGLLKLFFSFFLKIVASWYSKFVCFLFFAHFLALMFIEKLLEKRFFSWILETAIYREFKKNNKNAFFCWFCNRLLTDGFKKYVYFFIFLKKLLHHDTLSLFFLFFLHFLALMFIYMLYTVKKRTKKRKKSVAF